MTDVSTVSWVEDCDVTTITVLDETVVELLCDGDTTTIVSSDTIGPPGPPGPQGPPGEAGVGVGSYVHDQAIAAGNWTITHNLGFYPNVTVIETTGDELEGVITYVSANQTNISFSVPVSGTAYLS